MKDAILAIGLPKKAPEAEEPEEDEDDVADEEMVAEQEDAARDILAAFKADDAAALSEALKRHYSACEEY